MMLQRRLLGFVREAPGPVVITTLLGLSAVACLVGQGLLIAVVVRDVFDGAHPSELVAPIVGVAGLALLRLVSQTARDLAGNWTAATVKQRVRHRLVGSLLDLGPGGAAGGRSGHLQATIADGVEALQAYVGAYIPQAAVAMIAPLALVGVMFWLDPVVGTIVFVAAMIVPIARPLWRGLLGDRGKKHWDAYTVLSDRMLESLQGVTTLKMLDATEEHGRAVQRDTAHLYRATVGNLGASLGVYCLVTVAMGVGTALAVGVGGLRFADGAVDATSLLLVLFLAAECFRPLLDLQNHWHEGFYGIAASSGIFELLDAQPLVRDTGERDAPGSKAPSIRFDGVDFTYPGSDQPALRGVDLEVAGGETVAIVGPSGAGKSTLVALLQRWFDPSVGGIQIDGEDLRVMRLAEARRLVAVVSQDVHLFTGSVADNLRLARPDASDAELRRAAKLARAHGFIMDSPDGYDTQVGERGTRLSGGERQRIAIARALLADAPILVLDEATSSVDGENEAAIQAALRDLTRDRTTVVIAHRLSTVASADRIAVLDRGRVVESGAPVELLDRRGRYAQLVEAQVGAS